MRAFLPVIIAIVPALVAGGWYALKFFQIQKKFSFHLEEKIDGYGRRIERLERRCHGRHKESCYPWVQSSAAWRSKFTPSDLKILEESCGSANRSACRHAQRLSKVLGAGLSLWNHPNDSGLFLKRTIAAGRRFSFLESESSYARWIELSYSGMLADEGRLADVICGTTREFPQALVCAFYGQKEMNLAFNRIAASVEQNSGWIAAQRHKVSPLNQYWQGHNLRRADVVDALARLAPAGGLLPEEREAWDLLLGRPWEFILAFNVFAVLSGIPSHEFLHGVYFASPEYRAEVDELIHPADLAFRPAFEYVSSLYTSNSPFVRKNEIQAYLLQSESPFQDILSEASSDAVGEFVQKARAVIARDPRWAEFLQEHSDEN